MKNIRWGVAAFWLYIGLVIWGYLCLYSWEFQNIRIVFLPIGLVIAINLTDVICKPFEDWAIRREKRKHEHK